MTKETRRKSCWVLLVFNPFYWVECGVRSIDTLTHKLFEKFLMKFSFHIIYYEQENIEKPCRISLWKMRECFRLVALASQPTTPIDSDFFPLCQTKWTCSVNFWINVLVSWKFSHLLDSFFSTHSLARKVNNGSIKNVENRLSFSHDVIERLMCEKSKLSGMWKS